MDRPLDLAPLDALGDPAPHGRLLSNGRLTTLVTGAGSGFTRWDGLAVTGWSGDRTCDDEGAFVYVRDVDRGSLWSIGQQPVRGVEGVYRARWEPGSITIARRVDDLEAELAVAVAPDDDVELRRMRFTNHTGAARTIEVTSYAELVIHDPAAHASHPVFSRLFVQTEWAAEDAVLLARRRPNGPGARVTWAAHTLCGGESLEHETDRRRFLGRGRERSRPLAMEPGARLSGTTGSVLDPVFAIRSRLRIEAGATVEVTSVHALATSRESVLAPARRFRDPSDVAAAFEGAARRAQEIELRLALAGEEGAFLHDLATALLYGYSGGGEPRPYEVDLARARAFWDAHALPIAEDDETVARVAAALDPRRVCRAQRGAPPFRPWPHAEPGESPTETAEALHFDNGFGGFSEAGDEYVIRVGASSGAAAELPPLPWVNVVANERVGFLASERGAGYTWSRNSREHRLTPWRNDPVSDPHGEAFYVRDRERGAFWSPCPGPVTAGGPCEVRHGFGYSTWRRRVAEIDHELTLFVPRDAPVRVARLRLTNRAATARTLEVFSYAQLILGGLPADTRRSVVTERDEASGALLARNPASIDFADGVTFAAALPASSGAAIHCTADRAAFLGPNGSVSDPSALAHREPLDGRTGAGLDPCAAFQVAVTVPPRETAECTFLLGEAADVDEARALVAHFAEPGAVATALSEARDFWQTLVSAVRVRTPAPEIDLMVNGWLAYQTLSCRMWGRSAFYQSGGAYGFRDQLQDSAGLVYHRPALTRAQIALHAAHQFVEGDVLHWWHPPADRGTRTRFSDDLVWLPYIASHYVHTTGDATILDEHAPFVRARLLEPDEDETYLKAERADESAPIYEHCCRVMDRSLTHGAHGLPLMGTGDWNDGMNRVGREGRGESVWLAFFLVHVIDLFAPICEDRGDVERAARYRAYRDAVRDAIENEAWDGDWYRRAYFDDGTPLGSKVNDECRIDAIAQAWAVISGVAPKQRAESALDAVERELVLDDPGMIKLLAPPFDQTPQEPGYIKGYVPGIRENGGQYTHGALWVVRALAEAGRRDRAAELLRKLSPVHHGRDRAAELVYQVEPYVVVADIYGVDPHLGRGGWTWYTGSSGWMIRVALESVLGVTIERGEVLVVRPRIPDAWSGFELEWRAPDGATRYVIEVVNPSRRAERVVTADVDGQAAEVVEGAARIPIARDGFRHRVRITTGA